YSATGVSPVSDCKSASQRSASGNPCVTTAMNRPGNRRASAATRTASLDPARPPTRSRVAGPGSVLVSRVKALRCSTASSRRGRATSSGPLRHLAAHGAALRLRPASCEDRLGNERNERENEERRQYRTRAIAGEDFVDPPRRIGKLAHTALRLEPSGERGAR